MKTRELLALEACMSLVNAHRQQEISRLRDVLTSVGLNEVVEAGPFLDDIMSTPSPEQEEEEIMVVCKDDESQRKPNKKVERERGRKRQGRRCSFWTRTFPTRTRGRNRRRKRRKRICWCLDQYRQDNKGLEKLEAILSSQIPFVGS